jgi:hypothetical protein
MSRETAFYVAIFATAAMALGFFWRSFRGAAKEAVVRAHQAAEARNARDTLIGKVALIAVIAGAVLYLIATHHHK